MPRPSTWNSSPAKLSPMPFDTCPDLLVDESPTSRRFSTVLAGLATAGLFGSLLIASPSQFSKEHLADHSPLRWVVDAISLYGKWPTPDGKEIRLAIFNLTAALILLTIGVRLLTQTRQPRMALDDLLDFRARAASPVTWAVFFLFCSVLSSSFADSRRLALGQSALHGFQVAWLLPLALFLEPAHARKLARIMMWILSLVAVIGLWHYAARLYPNSGFAMRLRYPMASELQLAVCLLPMPFLAVASLTSLPTKVSESASTKRLLIRRHALTLLMLIPVVAALALTRSRSAIVGGFIGAAVMIALYMRGLARKGVIVAAVGIIAAAAFWVAGERNKIDSRLRGHSIRARVDNAWPYALALWRIKPILGHGDGAYGLLAGQLAREGQIDDPGVMGFGNEASWLLHADSEPLQLLADLGVVGLLAAAAGVIATLVVAVRYCDEARTHPGQTDRPLVIGLVSALVAIAAEECTSNGLRLESLPAVFLTTGAILWALIRRHRAPREVAPSDQWMPAGVLRMSGLGITGVSLALAVAACLDATATRSLMRASSSLENGRNSEAVIEADIAARGSLSLYQNLNARQIAIWAMSQEFDNRLKSAHRPDDVDLSVASAALGRLASLQTDAPRFLRTAALRVELFTNLARASERRGESANAVDFAHKRNDALARLIADEPFRLEPVKALFEADPAITALQRLTCLRRLIRAGEINQSFVDVFVSQTQAREFVPALNDLINVALNDASRDPAGWQDRLSPETLRLAALTLELQNKPRDALPLITKAIEMYDRAGARLFAANGAARHEEVRLRFAANPISDVDLQLQRLDDAARIADFTFTPSGPLPSPMGTTRLDILLAAGRESQATAQAEYLFPSNRLPPLLASGYASLASNFGRTHRDDAIRWATRACELAPQSIEAHTVLLNLLLAASKEDAAATALGVLSKNLDPAAYETLLDGLKKEFPQSRIWENSTPRSDG